ncbi:MAG: molybdopterin adenylyltransferase [Anaerolineaceae bacterium]|jgi:molybdenum cofactor synthesis domain-containing protein|nr:molybdopterin adenylyltransferase [Anaerolineaceae bacterium]OQY91341.1 MAG: molybdopterin adenylyltransferase [Anaerolineae bacterium UTCFX1]
MIPRVGILTVSDRAARGEREDLSGPALANRVEREGWRVVMKRIVPDDETIICEALSAWADADECDLILTTGGSGFAPRDITPEATRAIIQREAPGLAEAMRATSLKTTPHAMLSRGVAGIRRRTLIVNMPGSPKGAVENLDAVIAAVPHAVQLLQEDPQAEKNH